MKTYYYVDLENINSRVPLLLSHLRRYDKVLVFHSCVAATLPIEFLLGCRKCRVSIDYQFCTNGHKNAMDFYIAMEVARGALEHPEDIHIIVSDDTGYSSALKEWVRRGYNTQLLGFKEHTSQDSKIRQLALLAKNGDNPSSLFGSRLCETFGQEQGKRLYRQYKHLLN